MVTYKFHRGHKTKNRGENITTRPYFKNVMILLDRKMVKVTYGHYQPHTEPDRITHRVSKDPKRMVFENHVDT